MGSIPIRVARSAAGEALSAVSTEKSALASLLGRSLTADSWDRNAIQFKRI